MTQRTTLLAEQGAIFLLAVQFLTRLPVRNPALYTEARMAAIPRYFPAVGLLTGALMAAVWWVALLVFPPMLAALVTVAFGLLLTGAFHEDGFADACDGLGGGMTRARALEIMRDSRLGTYGAAGLGMMLAGRVAAMAALAPFGAAALGVLIAGQALSRASAVMAIVGAHYARDHGTAKPVQEGVDGASLAMAMASALAVVAALAVWLGAGPVLAGLGGLLLGHAGMRLAYTRKIGGYTGDCLGGVQQCSEIGFLLGVLAWLGAV
ncbi:MAG: adenosylcobinamide-GDP ribazoletransferase [Pararhodobacter sp.]|nr:adenosylcobinamide-GDP ribazoletransferase [Pararhodobacter sp.]